MDLDLSAIVREFQAEATEHLEALNQQLLKLEREPTAPGTIRAMFLSAHTIKGSAAMLDLGGIRSLAHAVEDVLAHLRDTGEPLDPETADLLFRALDALRTLVAHAAPGKVALDPPAAALMAALRDRAAGRVEVQARPAAERPTSSAAPRALLVDDSATVRLLEAMQLSDAGFDVEAVADGRHALDLALAQRYDVIVTGIECAGLRGWDLVAALREVVSSRPVPIILMSSDSNPDHRRRAQEAGIHAYLCKGSLRRQQLEEAARELLTARGRSTDTGGGA